GKPVRTAIRLENSYRTAPDQERRPNGCWNIHAPIVNFRPVGQNYLEVEAACHRWQTVFLAMLSQGANRSLLDTDRQFQFLVRPHELRLVTRTKCVQLKGC